MSARPLTPEELDEFVAAYAVPWTHFHGRCEYNRGTRCALRGIAVDPLQRTSEPCFTIRAAQPHDRSACIADSEPDYEGEV